MNTYILQCLWCLNMESSRIPEDKTGYRKSKVLIKLENLSSLPAEPQTNTMVPGTRWNVRHMRRGRASDLDKTTGQITVTN